MKYSVGDYVANDQTVFLKIEAAIEGEVTVYGVKSVNHGKVERTWLSEYELDEQGMTKRTPNFEAWANVQQGDLVHMGVTADRPYLKVLARVGDLIMLSAAPTTGEMRQKINKVRDMASQIEELTNGAITKEDIDNAAPTTRTISQAHKTTHGDWHSIEEIALMNWEVVGKE